MWLALLLLFAPALALADAQSDQAALDALRAKMQAQQQQAVEDRKTKIKNLSDQAAARLGKK